METQASEYDDTNSIEVYQYLDLKLRKDDNGDVRLALIKAATTPWKHVKWRETTFSIKGQVDDRSLAFERREGNGLVRVWIHLYPCEDCYRVVNILPVTEDSISLQKHNRALRDFVMRVVVPASEKSAFKYVMSADRVKPEDWLGEKTGSALRCFSEMANRETGNTDLPDWERWVTFVIEARKCEQPLQYDLIKEWLREIEGWSEEHASALTKDCVKGVDLLRHYDLVKTDD